MFRGGPGISTPAPTMTTPAFTAQSRAGFLTMAALLVGGLAYIVYGVDGTRIEGLPSVLIEYTAWVAMLTVAMARSPGAALRVSDPYLMLLGLGFNSLLLPGILWVQGADLESTAFEFGRLRMNIFIQLQWLHILFMGSLSAAYFALAPPPRFLPLSDKDIDALPRSGVLIGLGLLPFAIGVAQRVAATGSLMATQNYGDVWYQNQDDLNAVYAEGGSALVATQFLGKVWFLPWLCLGIGEGFLLARLLRQKRTLPIVLFTLQIPVLLLLNTGGRSIIAAPFLIALFVADSLAGPIPWRGVFSVGALGTLGFNFFGFYRGYRDREFREAIEMANERFSTVSRGESLSVESTGMLIKEHFAVAWTDAHNYSRGLSYFSEQLLALLPQQIVPEKKAYMTTANFLSHEFLGATADRGAGVAGAIVVDGYMIGRELGVIVLGAVLGAIAGAVTRGLGRGNHVNPIPLWQVALLSSWSYQGIVFFRAELTGVVSQLATLVVLPALGFMLYVSLSPASRWRLPVYKSP